MTPGLFVLSGDETFVAQVRNRFSPRYEVVVERDGSSCNIRDVGIGISQVLPVLTVAHFAPVGSTIVLEEPEIHLHPLAQSVLAELFVEVSHLMVEDFYKFPSTPHLLSMSSQIPRDDKLIQPDEMANLLSSRRLSS